MLKLGFSSSSNNISTLHPRFLRSALMQLVLLESLKEQRWFYNNTSGIILFKCLLKT